MNRIVWTPYGSEPRSIEVTTDDDAFGTQIALVESAVARGVLEVDRPSPRLDDSLAIMELLTEWEAACLARPDVT